MIINGTHVTTTNATTGELIAEHHIEPAKDYQRKTTREPTPKHTKKDPGSF